MLNFLGGSAYKTSLGGRSGNGNNGSRYRTRVPHDVDGYHGGRMLRVGTSRMRGSAGAARAGRCCKSFVDVAGGRAGSAGRCGCYRDVGRAG
eukprot:3566255-Pyramimonas_sp.AAC.1